MEVTLERCGHDELPIVARLIEQLRHDLSAFRPYALDADGTYGYQHLEAYVTEPAREACLVRVDGELAGFTMTRMLETTEREVAEFFVVRRWRRQGVGQEVAATLFRRHPGPWLVEHDAANVPASRFWPATIRLVADGEVRVSDKPLSSTFPGTAYRFHVADDRPRSGEVDRKAARPTLARGRIAGMSQIPAEGERTDELARMGTVRIEQILTGTADADTLYDQDQDEWVVLLDGHATLEVAGEQVQLLSGDWLLLPAGTPHRVLSATRGSRWIAVHHFPS